MNANFNAIIEIILRYVKKKDEFADVKDSTMKLSSTIHNTSRRVENRQLIAKKIARIQRRSSGDQIHLDPVRLCSKTVRINISQVSNEEHSQKRVKGYQYLQL
jgi:hypothetical protein